MHKPLAMTIWESTRGGIQHAHERWIGDGAAVGKLRRQGDTITAYGAVSSHTSAKCLAVFEYVTIR